MFERVPAAESLGEIITTGEYIRSMFLGFIDLKPLTTAKKVILHFYLPYWILKFSILQS
ncbi:hypothetical protein GBFDFA_04210 [Edwardsiella anguillarum]|nr:hypothetical protein PBOPBF_04210 [Edwardsiella anguillarum]BET83336.1 hypothetical protein GHNJMD_04520 [Edwardsiella anguillarum]BET86703.1 hypothetical protein GBFDFA_04210 [Edwardsiella anguillarum]BET90129.1 hypothetical protein BIKEJJ_04215 [Edwardsiella anguillarum]